MRIVRAEKVLTDGSKVYDVVLDGAESGSVRLSCVSRRDADGFIERFIDAVKDHTNDECVVEFLTERE